LGKLLYFNGADAPTKIVANRRKLRIHLTLVGCFFIGGVVGAVGFKTLGYVTSVPLALLLAVLFWGPFCTTSDRVASPRVCLRRTVDPTGRRAPTNSAALRVKPLGAKSPSTLDLKTAHALALP
jgi:hypothetical protein